MNRIHPYRSQPPRSNSEYIGDNDDKANTDSVDARNGFDCNGAMCKLNGASGSAYAGFGPDPVSLQTNILNRRRCRKEVMLQQS